MALGQAIGVAAAGAWDPLATLLGAGQCVALLGAVVLLNDYGDREVDALKRHLYPDAGSPKTIPDGILGAQALLLAGLGAAALALAIGGAAELWLPRPGAFLGAAACLGIFVAYSFPPLRLNYRGGGEYLEMLGVGVLLPWFNAYLQGGDPAPALALALLPGFALLALASAVTSGLADEVSDRRGGKVTFTTRYGNVLSRTVGENLMIAGALLWAFAARTGALSPWVVLPAVLALVIHWRDLLALSPTATTNAFPSIGRYKRALNQAIAESTLVLALALVIATIVQGSGGRGVELAPSGMCPLEQVDRAVAGARAEIAGRR
ncbi:MAG: prenyltransferase [Myxococcales bacterium]|nr:prenyltransferase [Myxococcales bacterium]